MPLRPVALCVILWSTTSVGRVRAQDDVEIVFEPMGDEPPPPAVMDLLSQIQNRRSPSQVLQEPAGGAPRATAHTPQGREAQLDNVLEDMVGSLLNAAAPAPRPGLRGSDDLVETDALGPVFISRDGPGGLGFPREFIGGPGLVEHGRGGRVPAAMFRDLFPGPLAMGPPMGAALPFDGPDHLITEMLNDMDASFREQVLPVVQRTSSAGRVPMSCQSDIQQRCLGAKSWLHCLGKHPDALATPCKEAVSKSVPFICSEAIDRFCDVLKGGIIPCLEGHLREVEPPCQDAISTTRSLVDRVNKQKSSLLDRASGSTTVVVPTTAAPMQREAALDRRLGHLSAAAASSSPREPSSAATAPPTVKSNAGDSALTFILVAAFVMGIVALTRLVIDMHGDACGRLASNEKECSKLLTGAEIPTPVEAVA